MTNKTTYLSNDNLTSILNKVQHQTCIKTKIHQTNTNTSTTNTTSTIYYTSNTLLEHITELVNINHGRISISKISLQLDVNKNDILKLLESESTNTATTTYNWNVVATKSKDEVIINNKLYNPILHNRIVELIEEARHRDNNSNTTVSVSELTVQLDLPSEIIESCIDSSSTLVLLNKSNQRREVVTTKESLSHRLLEVEGVLLGISQPTTIASLLVEYEWDSADLIKEYLQSCALEQDGDSSPGELCHSNEVYIPHVFLHMQRKLFDDFFSSNGYISEQYCCTLGYDHRWTTPKLIDYMKESFSDAIDLSSSSQNQIVINPIIILPPMEASILECISNKSIVNFLSFIPEPLYHYSHDLLEKYILPNLLEEEKAVSGTIVIPPSLDYVLYISSDMFTSIHNNSIPKWVNEHAIATAKHVFQAGNNSKHSKQKPSTHFVTSPPSSSSRSKKKSTHNDQEHEDDFSIITSTTTTFKKKRRNKNSKKTESSHDDIASTTTTPDAHHLPPDVILPLHELAKLIGTHYPDFLSIHTSLGYDQIDYDDDVKSWIHDHDDINEQQQEYEVLGPIYYFLQTHLYDYIKTISIQAYYQEYNQLQALSIQTAINSNTMNISPKMKRTIISSFEDSPCFPTSCYWIQLLAKSFLYFDQHLLSFPSNSLDNNQIATITSTSSNSAVVSNIQSILAADFAKRITQYCLFIHDIPLDLFSFSNISVVAGQGKEEVIHQLKQPSLSQELPDFCQPVNVSNYLSSSSKNKIFLSCSSSPRDPLQVLREELSDGIGVALARMWVYVGSKHYHQNNINNNNHKHNNSDNWKSFFTHLESNAYLFTDGLPFKKLDKKMEKQLLFKRKCTLMQELTSLNIDDDDDYYNNAKNIIILVIILLFQQVKHLVVTADFIFESSDTSFAVVELLLKSDRIPEKITNDIQLIYNLIQEEKEHDIIVQKDLVERVKSYGLCRDISKLQ